MPKDMADKIIWEWIQETERQRMYCEQAGHHSIQKGILWTCECHMMTDQDFAKQARFKLMKLRLRYWMAIVRGEI